MNKSYLETCLAVDGVSSCFLSVEAGATVSTRFLDLASSEMRIVVDRGNYTVWLRIPDKYKGEAFP